MSASEPLHKFIASPCQDTPASSIIRGRVLAVISSATMLPLMDGTVQPCGYHLCELVDVHRILAQEGFQMLYATPDGKTPLPDPSAFAALPPIERDAYERYCDTLTDLLMPLKLSEVTEEMLYTLAGVFLFGGHSALADFPNQIALKRILKHMKKHMKPITAIGHGVAGLLQFPESGEPWLFYDYEMTCFPKALEERCGKRRHHALPKLDLSAALDDLGAELRFHHHYNHEFIVEFKELLTGQNSASSKAIAKLAVCHLRRLSSPENYNV